MRSLLLLAILLAGCATPAADVEPTAAPEPRTLELALDSGYDACPAACVRTMGASAHFLTEGRTGERVRVAVVAEWDGGRPLELSFGAVSEKVVTIAGASPLEAELDLVATKRYSVSADADDPPAPSAPIAVSLRVTGLVHE